MIKESVQLIMIHWKKQNKQNNMNFCRTVQNVQNIKTCLIARPPGVHYNLCVSPSVRQLTTKAWQGLLTS